MLYGPVLAVPSELSFHTVTEKFAFETFFPWLPALSAPGANTLLWILAAELLPQ